MNKLLQIQLELNVPKNRFNSFGKYKFRSQEDILDALKPLLKKHNCVAWVGDEIRVVADTPLVVVESTVSIKDLDTDEVWSNKASAGVELEKKGMDLSQSFGASSSYARKYAWNGLLLIDDVADADQTNTHGKTEHQIIDENQLAKTNYYEQIKDMKKLSEVTEWWSGLNKSEKKYAVSAKDRKKRELLDIDTKIKNIKSNTTDKILTDIESSIDQITDGAEKESAITAYNNKLEKVGIDHKYEPLPFG